YFVFFGCACCSFFRVCCATASCSLRVSPQNASLPKVSKRKICLPSAGICCALWLMASSYPTYSGVVCAAAGRSWIKKSAPKARLMQAPATNLGRLEEDECFPTFHLNLLT